MKIKVFVEELYRHELIIESDEEVSESKLKRILNRAERESNNLDDVQFFLEESGFDVVEVVQTDYSSPHDFCLEMINVAEI